MRRRNRLDEVNYDDLSEEQIKGLFDKTGFPDEARYKREKEQLKALRFHGGAAFTEQQMNRIILREGSAHKVSRLIMYHPSLRYWLLTPSQACDMATHGGGSVHIQAFLDFALWAEGISPLGSSPRAILDNGFDVLAINSEQFFTMLASSSGADQLETYKALIPWVVKIAPPALGLSYKNPKAALDYAFKVLGINSTQIINLLDHHGGVKRLEAYQDFIIWVIAIAPPEFMLDQRPEAPLDYARNVFSIHPDQVLTILTPYDDGVRKLQAYQDLIPWAIAIASPTLGLNKQQPKEALDYAFTALATNSQQVLEDLSRSIGLRLLKDRQASASLVIAPLMVGQQAVMASTTPPFVNHSPKRKATTELDLDESERDESIQGNQDENHLYGNLDRKSKPSCLNLLYFAANSAAGSANAVLLDEEAKSLLRNINGVAQVTAPCL